MKCLFFISKGFVVAVVVISVNTSQLIYILVLTLKVTSEWFSNTWQDSLITSSLLFLLGLQKCSPVSEMYQVECYNYQPRCLSQLLTGYDHWETLALGEQWRWLVNTNSIWLNLIGCWSSCVDTKSCKMVLLKKNKSMVTHSFLDYATQGLVPAGIAALWIVPRCLTCTVPHSLTQKYFMVLAICYRIKKSQARKKN